jgi:hypothetical protein
MNKIKFSMLIVFLFFMIFVYSDFVSAQNADVCVIFFTGVNCSECDYVSYLIYESPDYAGNLTVIEYELNEHPENIPIAQQYMSEYDLPFSMPEDIPLLLFGYDNYLKNKDETIECLRHRIDALIIKDGNECPTVTGSSVPPENLGGGEGGNGGGANFPGSPAIQKIEGRGQMPDITAEPEADEDGGDGDVKNQNNLTSGSGGDIFQSVGEGLSSNYPVTIAAVLIIFVLACISIAAIKKKRRFRI